MSSRRQESAPPATNWSTVIASIPGQHIGRLEVFDSFMAVDVDHDAARSVRVFRRADLSEIPVPRPAGVAVVEMPLDKRSNRGPVGDGAAAAPVRPQSPLRIP